MNVAMTKSTPQECHRDILKCDPHLDADDFPLVLRSPTEVDGISDNVNIVKFQLRPRPSCDGDVADAAQATIATSDGRDEGACQSPFPQSFLRPRPDAVRPSTDDENVAPGECESPLPNAIVDINRLRRYHLRTPPPRLALKPRLRPRSLHPRIRGGNNPTSSDGTTAPAAFPCLGRLGTSGPVAPSRLCLSEITSGIRRRR